jgi:ubiquinone/menaquinone biosynthesis C-methylase UbiE
MSSKNVKNEITEWWDFSAYMYDDLHGHGIKSDEEFNAWRELFQRTIRGKELKVLDVGCGTGEISLVLASLGHHVTGIDLSEKMMAYGKLKAEKIAKTGKIDLSFKVGDAENPPFEDCTFDVVVTRHVLWTLPHPQVAVSGWARVLKEGGKLVVIDSFRNTDEIAIEMTQKVAEPSVAEEGKKLSTEHYSAELYEVLPHSKTGVPPDNLREYMRQAGLKGFRNQDLVELRIIQRKHMPPEDKSQNYKSNYFALDADKPMSAHV